MMEPGDDTWPDIIPRHLAVGRGVRRRAVRAADKILAKNFSHRFYSISRRVVKRLTGGDCHQTTIFIV
jgi:hypothetical protein